jgi:hypothetical protein
MHFGFAQYKSPGFRFPVPGCALFLVLGLSLVVASCGSEEEKPKKDTSASVPPVNDPLPFEINLLPGYKVNKQQGEDFIVYYFQAEDTSMSDHEGGIYFGSAPDTSAPRTQEYTRREFRDLFMGDSTNWREYTTATYVQREVYLDLGPQEKIHAWCYSDDPAKLDQLYKMIQSIK